MIKTCTAMAVLAASLCAMGAAHALQDDADIGRTDLICSEDAIVPAFVEHNVDEFLGGGELLATYNYIDYHFEKDAHYMRARTFLDEVGLVVMFGPYESFEDLQPVSDNALREYVVSYLKRRFGRIEEFSENGGRTLVWEGDDSDGRDLSNCEAVSEDGP